MKKQYKNFAEQVDDNVEEMELFDGELWLFWEELYNTIYNNIDDETVEEIKEATEITDEDSEEFEEAEHDYVMETMDGVYQVYKVELKGEYYTSEHERLEIVWDYYNDCWLMPVYCYGMTWSMVGVSN